MFKSLLWRWAIGCVLIGGAGCAILGTPSYVMKVKDLDIPLQILQKTVVATLPLGLHGNSGNGREFYSKYFVVSKGTYKEAGASVDRFSAKFVILNDRRPYDIEISVIDETRVLQGKGFAYKKVGYDVRLAKELENSLRSRLTKRREELNIIDDFRAF